MIDAAEAEFSVVEAATQPEVDAHPNTVDKALRAGELAFRWKRGRRLIRRSDLLAWAATRRRSHGFVPAVSEARAS